MARRGRDRLPLHMAVTHLDVRSQSGIEPLDVDNPLAGRSIRFYPNVFGSNTKGVPVLDAVMASKEAVSAAAADAAEGRRLAYVGMTRARDTIIVAVPPSAPRNDAWIRSFESEHLLATGDVLALPEGESVPSGCRALAVAAAAVTATDPFTPAWFHERDPVESSLRERLSPSEAESFEGAAVARSSKRGLGSRFMAKIWPGLAPHSMRSSPQSL